MTVRQKRLVEQMRLEGKSYGEIAAELGLSVNTVKSYGQRGGVLAEGQRRCLECGTIYEQPKGCKQKRFCCQKCRLSWWHKHQEQSSATIRNTCRNCGRAFISRPEQKYCRHACYIEFRFGGGQSDAR